MATIQIRDVPEDAYETIRRRARREGKSIQAYMRERIIEFAEEPTKEEALRVIEASLDEWGPAGTSSEELVRDTHAERR